VYVVVITTAGNQRYIFSSRKRKEIVGASDLIDKVNTTWACEALGEVFEGFDKEWRIAADAPAELVSAAAGAVTVLVRDDVGKARRLVTEVTLRALERAPELDVCGIVVEQGGEERVAECVRRARRDLAAVREARPGPQARFPRLPIVRDCGSTGLPAAGVHREAHDEPETTRSAASLAKLCAFEPALERLARDSDTDVDTIRKIVDRLGLYAEWVAVVHADGNGFGEMFGSLRPDDYVRRYRDLSKGADECARKALRVAMSKTAADDGSPLINNTPPVLPLVVGGDDLTVLCEGEVALSFTRHYLEAFEAESARNQRLHEALQELNRTELTAAAGVAIVKRTYPFRFAYDLAEELMTKEAKTVKTWASALAFTVLFESAAADLSRIRSSATLSSGRVRPVSPYVVGKGAERPEAERRRWTDLERRVGALRRTGGSDERLIPRGAVHDLREGLSLGEEVAASRLRLLRDRFAASPDRLAALAELEGDPDLLTWQDPDGTTARVTGLTDAMAAEPFLLRGGR
jgi:hypothetical protein